MAKMKITEFQELVKMWSKWNFQALLVWMQNGTATMENNLEVSYQVKHDSTI